MQNMLLSVIVPVYKVENFVLTFISSIYYQLNDNVELIIVDDSSPDNSIAIIKEFLSDKEPKNIVFIAQDNKGLSGARNSGIINASGQYISFVDPDDFVLERYIEKILEEITKSEFDILTFNANRVDMQGQVFSDCTVCSAGNDRLKCLNDIFNRGRWYAWARVIKKSIMTERLFPEGKRFEDLLTIPYLYTIAKSIVNIDNILISYRVNPEGITKNPTLSDIHDVKEFTDSSLQQYKSHKKICDDSSIQLAIYISALRTLFYLTNDVYGPVKSLFMLRKYIRYNLTLSFKEIFFFNRNNKLFIKFILLHYVYYFFKRAG